MNTMIDARPTTFPFVTSRLIIRWHVISAALLLFLAGSQAYAQTLTPQYASDFSLDTIASGFQASQLTLGPDGRLYASQYFGPLRSFAYNPNAPTSDLVLSDEKLVVSPDAVGADFPRGSLGVALHFSPTLGNVLYSNVAVPFSGGGGIDDRESGTIRRMNDINGDGIFGDPNAGEFVQDIITDLQVSQSHQVNHLLVRGDSLFFGVGVRTCSGGDGGCTTAGFTPAEENAIGEASYTGAINYIADINTIADTTTRNIAGIGITGLEIDGDNDGIADNLDSLTGAFDDNGPGVFRVFSTGFRNPFGITADDSGNLLVTHNQQENPTPPDAAFETSQFADHGFDKYHALLDNTLSSPGLGGTVDVEGNYRSSANTADARADGFFGDVTDPFATLGENTSANGIATFASNAGLADLRNDAVVAYRRGGKVVIADRTTGQVTDFVTGSSGDGLAVLRDPTTGDFLISSGSGIYRVASNTPLVDVVRLTLNADTGEASLASTNGGSADITGYGLTSVSGQLTVDGWQPLTGNGWDVAGAPSSTNLDQLAGPIDGSTQGGSTIGTVPVPIGSPLDTAGLAVQPFGTPLILDVTFEYTTSNGDILQGQVEVVGELGINNLLLSVDPDTGAATLTNSSTYTVNLEGYTISSASGSLNAVDWISLDDQNVDNSGIGGADGFVEEANTPTPPDENQLSELIPNNPAGPQHLTLSPGETYSLGVLFDTSGTQDLALEFLLNLGSAPAGDFNQDGEVNIADYTVWRDGLGGDFAANDYLVWKNNFDATTAADGDSPIFNGFVRYESLTNAANISAQIPEPSTMQFVVLVIAAVGVCRHVSPCRR